MTRLRILFLSAVVAVFGLFPAFSSPALANHTCGIDQYVTDDWGIITTVDYACDYYHNPKQVVTYVYCWATKTCV